jgi:hypothetical protein
MQKNENSIIKEARDFLYCADIRRIDILRIAQKINVPVQDLLTIAPTPEMLVTKIFNYELIEFSSIFDEYNFEDQNAIDVLIIVGQEVYTRFHDVNPAVSYHLKQRFNDLYCTHLENKINFLTTRIIENLKKGQAQGIYKEGLDSDALIEKFVEKVSKIHDHDLLSRNELTFEIIFNNLIEDFIRDISHKDGWNYYKNRKQLVETLNFNR